jgi:hypothetical protein
MIKKLVFDIFKISFHRHALKPCNILTGTADSSILRHHRIMHTITLLTQFNSSTLQQLKSIQAAHLSCPILRSLQHYQYTTSLFPALPLPFQQRSMSAQESKNLARFSSTLNSPAIVPSAQISHAIIPATCIHAQDELC